MNDYKQTFIFELFSLHAASAVMNLQLLTVDEYEEYVHYAAIALKELKNEDTKMLNVIKNVSTFSEVEMQEAFHNINKVEISPFAAWATSMFLCHALEEFSERYD